MLLCDEFGLCVPWLLLCLIAERTAGGALAKIRASVFLTESFNLNPCNLQSVVSEERTLVAPPTVISISPKPLAQLFILYIQNVYTQSRPILYMLYRQNPLGL